MTSISRVFGLIRDVVIASLFGPGAGVDAFIVAFRIPIVSKFRYKIRSFPSETGQFQIMITNCCTCTHVIVDNEFGFPGIRGGHVPLAAELIF